MTEFGLRIPARRGEWTLDGNVWDEIAPDGTRYALLEGRRDVAGGVFSYAFFIPAGFWDPAHHHTADARVFVAKGALSLGYGDELAPEMATRYPAGSFLLVPAGDRHFDGAREDTLIFGTAIGPWATHYVNPAHRPSAGTPE